MVISDIQKSKQHLMKIIFDDQTELLIDKDICYDNSLKRGDLLSNDQIESLKYDSDYSRAKSRALWYLDNRDYTEKELYDKLTSAGFNQKPSAAVIARLVELQMIDDRRFAENYVIRCLESNRSKRESLQKMLAKGVPYDIANEALSNTEVDEEHQIEEIISKKYLRKLTQENGTQKVYAALIRKGFSFGSVKSVLKKYSEQLEYSEE